jgi:hypothetical protein
LAIVVARRSWPEKNWERQEERKSAYKEKRKSTYKKEERWYPNSRAQPPRSGDCDGAWTSFPRKGTEVDNQVAAPTELGTPTMHRAKTAQKRVRMEGWRQRRPGSNAKNPLEGKSKQKKQTEKEKNALDSYRPSHGRHHGIRGHRKIPWQLKNAIDLSALTCYLKGAPISA